MNTLGGEHIPNDNAGSKDQPFDVLPPTPGFIAYDVVDAKHFGSGFTDLDNPPTDQQPSLPAFEDLGTTYTAPAPHTGATPTEKPAQPEEGMTVYGNSVSSKVKTPRGDLEAPWWQKSDLTKQVDPPVLGEVQTEINIFGREGVCWPTSVLIALVASGQLAKNEALAVQKKLLESDEYKTNFEPGTTHWNKTNAEPIAFAAREVTGRQMAYAPAEGVLTAAEVEGLLRMGRTAVVGTDKHYWAVFRPADYRGLVIVNPLSPWEPTLVPDHLALQELDKIHQDRVSVFFAGKDRA